MIIVRVIICFLWLGSGSVFGLSVQPTVNDGLGKWERINLNEKRLQEVAKELRRLKEEIKRLREQIQELEGRLPLRAEK